MESGRPVSILSATIVASIALVVSLVTSAIVASRAYLNRGEQQYRQARTLDVTGSAKNRITSDLAVWEIRVVGEAPKLEEAFQQLAASTDRVKQFLGKQAIPDTAVEIGPINTATHFRRDDHGNETRDVSSVELSRHFRITLPDVAKIAKAAGEVTELLQTGAHVESLAPEYHYTRLADLKIKMIGEAAADGRQRADQIAQRSKCRIGAVKEAKAGVLQITHPWSTDVTGSGVNDTSSIEKDVTAVVHLTFAIEPEP